MDELFKRKDFDINDFFMSPLKEIDNNKKKEGILFSKFFIFLLI